MAPGGRGGGGGGGDGSGGSGNGGVLLGVVEPYLDFHVDLQPCAFTEETFPSLHLPRGCVCVTACVRISCKFDTFPHVCV